MDAETLCTQVRNSLRDVEERIRGHQWLADLEAGRIPRAAIRSFAGEQFHVIPSDLSSFEMLAGRFADDPARGYLEDMAAGERAALHALEGFGAAVGLDVEARRGYEPIPGCQAYPSFVARLARDGTPAEVAGAFLVNLEAWGGNCARMHAALPAAYGLAEEDCAFFALFAAPATELERASLEVIDAGLTRGVDPSAIARAARLLQAYELLYWDSLPR
ncbi:MAG: transcriptional regulator [Pseudonocardiaceae bacterium]